MNNVIQKPWVTPTPSSIWFDYLEDSILTVSEVKTIIEFDIPLASKGLIKWFGQDVPSGRWSDVKWQLKINNGPDSVYGSIVGQVGYLVDPTEVFIYVPRSSNIKLVVENLSTVPDLQVLGRIKGWYWPED